MSTDSCKLRPSRIPQAPPKRKLPPHEAALAMIEEAATALLEHTPAGGDLYERLRYIQGIAHWGHDVGEDEACPGCGSYRFDWGDFDLRGGGSTPRRQCADCERIHDERGLLCSR